MNPAPSVAILDVNETLSNLAPLAERFEELGAPGDLLGTWFAATLRDGIALAASGRYAAFPEVAQAAMRPLLARVRGLGRPVDEAAHHVLTGIGTLPVHPDVEPGLRRMRDAGLRIATLTNGSAATAAGLLERAGIAHLVERNLDVSEVDRWKPAPEPYHYACRTLDIAPAGAVLIAAILGTSTARSAPGCAAPGSTATKIPIPACSAHPMRAPLSCRP